VLSGFIGLLCLGYLPACTPQQILIPDVVGMLQSAAEPVLADLGLAIGNVTQSHSDTVPAGAVIGQIPAAGTKAEPGTAVDLEISLGAEVSDATVPSVVGFSEADGRGAITAAGFIVGRVTTKHSPTIPSGVIISQNPNGGIVAARGTSVSIVVSSGPEVSTVPEVTGMSQSAAVSLLERSNLETGLVTSEYSASVPKGFVIRQNPVAGVHVASQTAVSLVVSLGTQPAIVPNVVGMLRANAESQALAAGLSLGGVTEAYHGTIPAGIVLTQNPAAGTQVLPGTAISFVISRGPEPVAIPNVVGMTQELAQSTITSAGFAVGAVTESFSISIPVGAVVSQSPDADSAAVPGTAIGLVISKGPQPTTVPNIVDATQTTAQALLESVGLAIGTVALAYSATVPTGNVMNQSPGAGTATHYGQTVDITVSQGARPVTVPDVVGTAEAAARIALSLSGLSTGTVSMACSEGVPMGTVISQHPAADTSVPPGTSVVLTVSLGTVEMSLHVQAWREAANGALSDKQFKYSLYSSRSLMVHNPEVYLQADAVWMEEIAGAYGGWQAEYSHRDRLNDNAYWTDAGQAINDAFRKDIQEDGTEFQWADFQWQNHRQNAVQARSLYDARAPFLSWADTRLPLLWNAIKGIGWKTPLLTLAEALYFQMRAEGKTVYVLVSDAERAYVAEVNGATASLFDPLTGQTISKAQILGSIVLAMNQRNAWYPLMGRDDSGIDTGLGTVVSTYCSASAQPSLTVFEQSILSDLTTSTEILSDLDERWAVFFAGRFGKQWSWRAAPLRELMKPLVYARYAECGNHYADNPYEITALNMVITEMGNRLSPAAAALAGAVKQVSTQSLSTVMAAAGNKYLNWFGRTDSASEWVYGEYFMLWLPNFDDKTISKVGDCFVEACNTGAALVISGVPGWNVWLTNWWELNEGGGHVIAGVYASGDGKTLSNGLYNPNSGACTHGPLWSANGVFAYPLIYKPRTGFITTGQSCNAVCFSPFDAPFVSVGYPSAITMLTEVATSEPGNLLATGDTSNPLPESVSAYRNSLEPLQVSWEAFRFRPLSTGLVAVPVIAGSVQTDAELALVYADLMPGKVTSDYSASVPAGLVIGSVPSAGISVVAGTAVDLVISQGPQYLKSSDYFVSTPGFGIEYRVTDSRSSLDEHAWGVFQDCDSSNDFAMTLNGATLTNSLGGELAHTWTGRNYLLLNWASPVRNQGNFFRDGLMLPTQFLFGDTWSFVRTAVYNVQNQGALTIGGETFPDCIRINVDDTTNSSDSFRGEGYLIMARNVGVVQLSFDRGADGTHVAYDYVSRGNYAKHTLSGTVTIGGAAAAGSIVQIHNASWGTRAVTDILGQFSIAAYGPEIVLRVGEDANDDGILDFAAEWPKEYPVHAITSDRTVTVAF
jgi:beta-lactam-binding protein with PASTA domain